MCAQQVILVTQFQGLHVNQPLTRIQEENIMVHSGGLRVNQTSQPPQQVFQLWQQNTVVVKYLFSNFKENINIGTTERIISFIICLQTIPSSLTRVDSTRITFFISSELYCQGNNSL